jgi:predicted CXXCH cytochrome family protein
MTIHNDYTNGRRRAVGSASADGISRPVGLASASAIPHPPRSVLIALLLTLLLLAPPALAQFGGIINSKHNLSASGPGTIRAVSEQEVCVFCHTPHGASAIQPLWNRNVPVSTYRVYSSTTLNAKPGQPTGSSKLCLSCHDGTVAIGSVLSKNMPIGMAGGITTIPPGAKGNIGTDLSDDHPISFVYDSALAAKDGKLHDPVNLPANVRLDATKNLQCSTCHDAHDNSNTHFLVMRNDNSQLCNTCHTLQNTNITAHAN